MEGPRENIPMEEQAADRGSVKASIPGRGGGKSSGTRRRQKSFRESVKAVLAMETPDEEKKRQLEELGVDPTVLNAVHLAVSARAAGGDLEAARYLRDTAGEKPRNALELGNLDGKPLAGLDMSRLTDEQLRILAAGRREEA